MRKVHEAPPQKMTKCTHRSLSRKAKANKPAACCLAVVLVLCVAYFVLFSRTARHMFMRRKAREPCAVLERESPIVHGSSLPKIVHQMVDFSKGVAFSPDVEKWHASFKRALPDHEIIVWDDDMLLEFIQVEFPWFLPTYTGYSKNIQRVDAARCFLLYKFGGLYADIDVEVHDDAFWDRLPDLVPAIIESPWLHERTQNAFMSSPAGHGFWRVTWDLMIERANSSTRSDDVLWTTGPTLLDDAITAYNAANEGGRAIRILPCECWNRLSVGSQLPLMNLWHANSARQFGLTRMCGDVDDHTCLMTEHHSMLSWVH